MHRHDYRPIAALITSCWAASLGAAGPDRQFESIPDNKRDVYVAPASYRVVHKIAAPRGGFDYVSIDSAAQRLFIAREYGVMAVDLETGTVNAKLVDGSDDSAVLVLPRSDEMLSTNWSRNTATLFDRTSGAIRARVQTGKGPDAAIYDTSSGLVYVMNSDSRDVSVIDTACAAVIETIPLDAKPEAAATNGTGRVFVNLEDVAQIAVIDTHRLTVDRHIDLPGCVEPTGIVFDPVSHRLVSACHNGVAKLIDPESGADRGTVPIGKDADGALFDTQRRIVAVPAADGTLTLFRLDETGQASDVVKVRTARGARTGALDESTGRIYIASDRGKAKGPLEILVVAP